jgi:glycosyltransferase involved in cell wall biosynthesis
MQKVILISAFGDISSVHNSRPVKIYSALIERYNVNFVTSDFDHWAKDYKDIGNLPQATYLHVAAYRRSLSFRRIFSHLQFAYELNKYLQGLDEKPDVICCVIPTSTSAYVCGRYCKKHGIRFVVDVIDLWPESLYPITKFSWMFKLLCYPWQKVTEKSYGYADVITAESMKYRDEAKKYNKTAVANCTYLGIDRQKIDSLLAQSRVSMAKSLDELWICYGGHLGKSYDFDSVLEALLYIQEKKIKYKCLFVGDGELRKKIEDFATVHHLNIYITGVKSYADYLKYLSFCDIAMNIFKENTKVVHSYKFNDYVALNLFILNSLVGETAEMINEYEVGLNFDFKNYCLKEVLFETCTNWNRYKEWKKNNEFLVDSLLDEKSIYREMINLF